LENGSESIMDGHSTSHLISFDSGNSIKVSYTVSVTSGQNIDIFFMDSANYSLYWRNNTFSYDKDNSVLDTKYARREFTLDNHGKYYLVFDNTDAGTPVLFHGPDSTVEVSYDIQTEVKYKSEGFSSDTIAVITGLFVAFIAVIVIAYIYYLKKYHPKTPKIDERQSWKRK
jgi:hypothetical protein